MNSLRTSCVSRKGAIENSTDICSGPGQPSPAEPNSTHKSPFPFAVPDYIQADWFRIEPSTQTGSKRGRRRIGRGLHFAIHQAVILQKTSRVILPDVLLAHVLWGDRSQWSKNWRKRIVDRLKRAAASQMRLAEVFHRERDKGNCVCPAQCALHGMPTKHHHLEIAIRIPERDQPTPGGDCSDYAEYDGTFLGAMEVFGYGD